MLIDRAGPGIVYTVAFALAGAALVLITGSVIRPAGWSLTVVEGSSMAPTIEPWDIVVGHAPGAGGIHVGDIVTFRAPEAISGFEPSVHGNIPMTVQAQTLVTHRVVSIDTTEGYFKTAGDAVGHPDPWSVPLSNVVAVSTLRIPRLGLLLAPTPGQDGLPIVVVLLVAVLVCSVGCYLL